MSARKPHQSRLSFGGEPAPDAREAPPAGPEARAVSEVVAAVQSVLGEVEAFHDLWVKGEVSNFRPSPSGHWYFTLKDEQAELKCAMFKGQNFRVRFDVEDGLLVLARGNVDVYRARGELQFVVSEMRPEGRGALDLALEQLRRRLEAEGLFDPALKRDLPALPLRVGVVTSPTGAVWHDIQKVARRRFPGVSLILAPVRVQGEGAAAEIAAAIGRFNAARAADVLIVGRGGGSLEDLWAFNEEVVVRAVRASAIPVVSAVGHETDFTLADFAADVRAATPSQAAELVTPYELAALLAWLEEAEARLASSLAATARRLRERLERAALSPALTRPERLLDERRRRLDESHERLGVAARAAIERKTQALAERAGRLDALSPLGVLARGYALATDETGRVVRSVGEARDDMTMHVRLKDGRLKTRVTGVIADAAEEREL